MKQLTDSLYQISLGAVNAFLLEDEAGLTLVDTGMPQTAAKLLAAIRQGGKRPEDITRILLTHWHPDHAGNASELQRLLKARVYAHPAEAALLAQGGGSPTRYLTPGLLNWLVFNLFIKRVSGQIAPVTVDELLTDGAILPIAGGLHVLHTPGHSAGHVALLLQREGVLLAGDLCSNLPSLAYSIVNEAPEQCQASILKAANFAFDQAVFGHGSPLRQRANAQLQARFQQPLVSPGQQLKAV